MTMGVGHPASPAPSQGRAFRAFGIIGWRWISRNPAVTISPVLLPFIFLYFLSRVSPPSLFPLEVVGALLFTTQNVGSWVLGDSAFWRLELGVQDMFVASPLGKLRYLFGIAFSNLIPALPALVTLLGVLAYVENSRGTPIPWEFWPALLVSVFFLWILFSAIGVAVSSRLKSQREIWPVGNLVFTILGILTPLYYPLSYLPGWWQKLAFFLPGTYAALLLQGVLGITPQSESALLLNALLLAVVATVGTVAALRLYRWTET